FEGRDIMFRNLYGYIFLDISTYLCSSFFRNKTTKTANVNVLSLGYIVFDLFEESFQRDQNINLGNAGVFGNIVNDICFSHILLFLLFLKYSYKKLKTNKLFMCVFNPV